MISAGGAPLNIANGFREFARAQPATTAVIDADRTLAYAELDERSSRLANALLGAGLTTGDRVAVILGNRLEFPEVAAGIAKAGLAMVPVNTRSTAAEAAYVLAHSGAKSLIVDAALTGIAADCAIQHVLELDGATIGADYEQALAAADASDPNVLVAETDPFCVTYTSGTTGKPKGVLINHRSRCLTFLATALEWGLGPGRRTIAVAPMYHGAGFAFAYAALHTGGTLSMLRAFDPVALLAMIERDRAQSIFLVPTHVQLLRALGDDVVRRADTSSLETIYVNAAPMPQPLKLWLMDTLPQVGLHELYGSTEAGIISNLRPADQRRKVNCVGPPWFMTEVRLVGPDGNIIEGPGRGELYSRSPYLMNGYLDDPEATAACTTEDGFLTCGDICDRDEDGYLYVVDRVKDLVISGGTNVYPREVEDVLRSHPSVADVAVVGTPDDTWGEAVTAVIVVSPGYSLDAESLDAHCRASLAGYKVPRRWHEIDALPRNAAGKVLKRQIAADLGGRLTGTQPASTIS